MKAEQLRKSILQMAIQGKLVPQDPNDEPASVLLERIRAEKQRLIKEGKIKKDKGDSIIFKGEDNCYYEKIGSEVKNIEDEIPFEIPDNWLWMRFPQLVYFTLGKTPDRHTDKFWSDGKYSWFSIADMQDKKIVTETKEKISEVALGEKFNNVLSPKGTLIMSFKLTVGRTSILGVDAVHNEAIISIFPYINEKNITRDYLVNTLGLLVAYVKQTDAIKGATLNSEKLKSMLVPVPPIAEQERIINKIREFEPLLFDYDKLETEATKLNSELYDKLKKSILQYAIQGKLVPQDNKDESASVLLEKIRAEKKSKLGKKHVDSYIYKGSDNCYYEKVNNDIVNITEKLPFTIPDSWSWSRIQQISDSYIGLTYKPTDVVKDYGNIVLRSSNIQNGEIDFSDIVRVNVEISEKLKVNKNDIIICARNGSKKLVGKSALVKVDMDNLTFGAFMAICKTPLYDYVSKFLLSPLFFEQLATVSGTTTINQLTQASFNSFFIPIPPLLEQQRIIKQLDLIFNKLKAEN